MKQYEFLEISQKNIFYVKKQSHFNRNNKLSFIQHNNTRQISGPNVTRNNNSHFNT